MKKKWIVTAVLASLGLISFYFDADIVKLTSLMRGDLLNEIFLGITFVSSEIIIFFFLTSLFLWKEHKRKWVVPLWITLFLSVVVSFILKYSVHRMRPFQQGFVETLPVLMKSSHLTWNFSFPSFQAMLVFCAIPILYKEFPKFKYIWLIFAGLVAFSRVYFGVHFLSDIIFGGIIGILIGEGIIKIEEKYQLSKKILR